MRKQIFICVNICPWPKKCPENFFGQNWLDHRVKICCMFMLSNLRLRWLLLIPEFVTLNYRIEYAKSTYHLPVPLLTLGVAQCSTQWHFVSSKPLLKLFKSLWIVFSARRKSINLLPFTGTELHSRKERGKLIIVESSSGIRIDLFKLPSGDNLAKPVLYFSVEIGNFNLRQLFVNVNDCMSNLHTLLLQFNKSWKQILK